jgi:hypothetical protein
MLDPDPSTRAPRELFRRAPRFGSSDLFPIHFRANDSITGL